ncbi:MAG TPA: glycosyltransferase, partial [Blastocatellia bacterium]|nr:glycosyltransferase [Blastocatellia bacterium]
MNIGITCFPTYGGSGVVGAELGLELARRDHNVHFIAYASPMRLEDGDQQHPRVRFHPVDMLAYPLFEYPPYTLALATKLYEVALSESLDLIH